MNRSFHPLVLMVAIVAAGGQAHGEDDSGRGGRFSPLTTDQRAAITKAVPDAAAASPTKPRRVLLFDRCEGYVHQSIPFGNFAFQEMGRKTGAFEVDLADQYEVFTPENLARYDGILLNNTCKLHFPEPRFLNAFLDFIAGGKGLAGFHGASDNFDRQPRCAAMVGGRFDGHPWNAAGTWAFKLNDPQHPLNQAFEGRGFWHRDEIYQYRTDSFQGPSVLRILISLDMGQPTVSERIDDGPREVPVSWIRQAGEGRVFYTNLGHRQETYQNPTILKHMLDGIQYSLGDLDADATPTAEISAAKPSLAPAKPIQ